ncbi:9-O-acetylesterase [Bacteroidia bacterium]|nr:9-O-acetylesterase [Bacteroidia bacterium]
MKNIVSKFSIACLFLLVGTFSSFARIELPKIFTNNLVLQQQTQAPVWGKATPDKDVTITTSWDKKTYTVRAGQAGKWKVKVQTPAASNNPYSITISDGKAVTLNNILIGEVWICSGQSNMEMPLAGWGKVKNYQQEIADANYPQIRLLQVDKATSIQPLDDLKGTDAGWQVCSPATVAEFSSVAYFFGRNLWQNLNVPVGLINTSWGGTIAEAWTSSESLELMPDFKEEVEKMQPLSEELAQKEFEQKFKAWNDAILKADSGLKDKWESNNIDDTDWQTMTLPGDWEGKGLPNFDGIVYFRKTVEIPAAWEGKELQLNLTPIDDNDITYFNGVQIGATNGYNVDRNYKIPAKQVKAGKAIITVRVTDTGGGGGFFGDPQQMYLSLAANPQETIVLANDWKYKVSVDASKIGPAPVAVNGNPNRPTVLYNAMIHPIAPYAIQGAIWYQGESNVGRAEQYKTLFPLMIRDWRKTFDNDFAFYFVQLANYLDEQPQPVESSWAELREAQLQTLALDNTGMAVIIDIGEAKDIHPKNKQDVGLRLALAARANTYKENIAFSGPIYQSHTIEGNTIRVKFSHTNQGLKTKDNVPLTGFAIAGGDNQYYWANAVIEGNEVVVSSPKVPSPVAVRYAWADNPVCNLYNGAGLPASPFRTTGITPARQTVEWLIDHPEYYAGGDGTHLVPIGVTTMAKQVAKVIEEQLKQ